MAKQRENYADSELLDDKLFAHIHGDSFIGNRDDLEGHLTQITARHFRGFLESLPVEEQRPELLQIRAFLEQAYDILSTNDNLLIKEGNFLSGKEREKAILLRTQQLVNDLLAKIAPQDSNKSPEPFTYHFAVRDVGGGHALLLQFDGRNLKIFNSGDGLEHHASHSQQGKVKYSPIVIYKNISLDPEILSVFFQALLESEYPDRENAGPVEAPCNADYIYSRLLPTLNGERCADPDADSDFIMDQTAGLCAERVLHAFLRHHLPQDNHTPVSYKRIMLHYKETTLKNYCLTLLKTSNISPTQKLLFEKSCSKQAARLEKLHDLKMITETEWRQGMGRLGALNEAFQNHYSEQRKALANTMIGELAAERDVKPDSFPTDQGSFPKLIFPAWWVYMKPFYANDVKQAAILTRPYPSQRPQQMKEVIELVDDFVQRNKALNLLLDDEKSGYEKSQILAEKSQAVTALASLLDVPTSNGERQTAWDAMTADEARQVFKKISSLAQEGLLAEMTLASSLQLPLEQRVIFVQAKLMTILHHLLEKDLPLLGRYRLNISLLSLFIDSPLAATTSLEQQADWQQITAYMAPSQDSTTINLLDWVFSKPQISPDIFARDPHCVLLRKLYPAVNTPTKLVKLLSDANNEDQLLPKFLQQQVEIYRALATGPKFYIGRDKPWRVASEGLKLIIEQPIDNPEKLPLDTLYVNIVWMYFLKDKDSGTQSHQVLESVFGNSLLSKKHSVNEAAVLRRTNSLKPSSQLLLRELTACLSNPNRQALEIIRLFQRHSELTQFTDYQILFEALLFMPGALESSLRLNPHFAAILASFIQEGMKRSNLEKLPLEEFFFLRIGALIEPFIKKYAPEVQVSLPNARQQSLELLRDPRLLHK